LIPIGGSLALGMYLGLFLASFISVVPITEPSQFWLKPPFRYWFSLAEFVTILWIFLERFCCPSFF
jgi:hypothetical protein